MNVESVLALLESNPLELVMVKTWVFTRPDYVGTVPIFTIRVSDVGQPRQDYIGTTSVPTFLSNVKV